MTNANHHQVERSPEKLVGMTSSNSESSTQSPVVGVPGAAIPESEKARSKKKHTPYIPSPIPRKNKTASGEEDPIVRARSKKYSFNPELRPEDPLPPGALEMCQEYLEIVTKLLDQKELEEEVQREKQFKTRVQVKADRLKRMLEVRAEVEKVMEERKRRHTIEEAGSDRRGDGFGETDEIATFSWHM